MNIKKNLINSGDLLFIINNFQKSFTILLNRLFKNTQNRTRAAWEKTSSPPTHWTNIRYINEVINKRITGTSHTHYRDYICTQFLSGKDDYVALSLGCGTGHREIKWAETGRFKKIIAIDLSPNRITFANEEAKRKNLDAILKFCVCDVSDISKLKQKFDIIIGEHSVHHFSSLDSVFTILKDSLKDDGLLIFNEYIGPNRFQWTPNQIANINTLLSKIPDTYKRTWGNNSIKKKVMAPGLLRMYISDPSEAVESEDIIPLMNKYYEILEFKGYGGTLLHPLLNRIAHNFQNSDSKYLLDTLINREDELIKRGVINDDFAVVIARKKLRFKYD